MRFVAVSAVALALAGPAAVTASKQGGLIAWTGVVRGSELMSVGAAGPPRAIGTGADPIPSPDGKTLAVNIPSGTGNAGIQWVLTDAAGGNPRRLPCDVPESWSPDSSRLACSTAGGTTEILDTSTLAPEGPALELSGVVWSPDGTRVAGIDLGGNLTVESLDGTHAQVVAHDVYPGTPLSWSHSGSRILYGSTAGTLSAEFPGSLEIVDLGTGKSIPLPVTSGEVPFWAAQFSPDGTQVTWAETVGYPGHESAIAFSLYVSKADGTGKHTLGAGQDPAWSPDGKLIAFESRDRRSIGVVPAAGGAAQIRSAAGPGSISGFAWLPHSGTLIYATSLNGSYYVYASLPDGTHATPLTQTGSEHGPSWSPDGTRIAWVHDTGSTSELETMKADGSDARVLLHRDVAGSRVSWSPDGKEIAFTGYSGPLSTEPLVELVGSNGGRPAQLESVHGRDPSWSPDGRTIIFSRAPDGMLMVAGANLAGARPLAFPRRGGSPSFSPDGKRVAYEDVRGNLWVAASNGSGAHLLAHGFDRPAWSADGTMIYGDKGETIRLGDRHPSVIPALAGAGAVEIDWQPSHR